MAADNPFSDNPFTGGAAANDNPFQDPAVTAAARNGNVAPVTSTAGGAWGAAGTGSASTKAYAAPVSAFGVDGAGGKSTKSKEAELARKEAELKAKEAELKRWEADLKRSGSLAPRKNWPRCFPITHLDIAGEVPAELQSLVTCAYWSYLGLVIATSFNVIATIVALIAMDTSSGRMVGFILALIYWFTSIPIAWVLWFKRLYNAAIKDRALTYAWFFLAYLLHIIWCIWSAVSPPILFNSWSHAGWIQAFAKALPDSVVTGIFYIVGAVFWTLESLLSVWVLKLVYSSFRGQKVDARLKSEAMQAAVSHAANRV